MSKPLFCSRCGKKIEGVCFRCNEEMRESLARRQAIRPGCPKISGEFRPHEDYITMPLSPHGLRDGQHQRRDANHADESGTAFDDVVRAYEDE